MRETTGYVILFIGLLFDLFGNIGLVRLPDVYNRLQASTKCVTLGTCLILTGVMILGGTPSALKAFLTALFILITAPTSAHAISRASHKAGVNLWEYSICDKLKEEEEK